MGKNKVKKEPVKVTKIPQEKKTEEEKKRIEEIKNANQNIKKPELEDNTAVKTIISNNVNNNESNKNSMVYIKKMTLGNKEITAEFHSKTKKRPNYYISEETTDLVDTISSMLGYPKSEFVDVYLKHGLTKVIKELQK